MANGRAARVEPNDRLATEDWLAVADVTGGGAVLRIQLAAPLNEATALDIGGVETIETATYDAELERLTARRVSKMGAITLSQNNLPKPSGSVARETLLDYVRTKGLSVLPGFEALQNFVARLYFLHDLFGDEWPTGFDHTLLDRIDEWLGPMFEGARSLSVATPDKTISAARSLLDWSMSAKLDKLAPHHWTTPTGRQTPIDYIDDKRPLVRAKAQEFFGLTTHPTIADGRAPLALELLSPAQRPIALTKDIRGFWSGGYIDMRKDMRGRYPKHDWPEDPANAKPQSGAKRRK